MNAQKTSPAGLSRIERILVASLALILRLWGRTLRFRWDTAAQRMMDLAPPPSVVILWHNRLFAAPVFYRRYFKQRQLAALVSASKDGAWLTELIRRLGLRPVRGSRFKRGAQALRDLIRAGEEGFDVALTPDGSRGPIYDMKPGAVTVAMKTGAPIVLLSLNHQSALRLRTWDRFFLPLPFSRIDVAMEQVAPQEVEGMDAKAAAAFLKERLDAMTQP